MCIHTNNQTALSSRGNALSENRPIFFWGTRSTLRIIAHLSDNKSNLSSNLWYNGIICIRCKFKTKRSRQYCGLGARPI